jgi:hypothetical protein
MNYIEYEDCQHADVLCDSEDIILLKDETLPLLHFAVNEAGPLIRQISHIPGPLRLHFVPKAFAGRFSRSALPNGASTRISGMTTWPIRRRGLP